MSPVLNPERIVYVYSFLFCKVPTPANPGPYRSRLQHLVLLHKSFVPTPGRVFYGNSIVFSTDVTRTHPGPDRLR